MYSTLNQWSQALHSGSQRLAAFAFVMLSLNASWVVADTDTTATLRGFVDVDNVTVTLVHEPTGLTKTQE